MSKDIDVCAVLSPKVLGTSLDSLTARHCSPPRGRVGIEGRVSAVLAGSTRAGKGVHQANRLWEGQRGLWGDCVVHDGILSNTSNLQLNITAHREGS